MRKDAAKRLLNDTFGGEYDEEKFIDFVREVFKHIDIDIQDNSWYLTDHKQYEEYISDFRKMGEYKDSKGESIEILSVKLKRTSSRDRARTMQRNFVASWLSKTEKNAGLVAFYGDDPEDWRLSFVKVEYVLDYDKKGKVTAKKVLSSPKRYSFLVGKNEPNHTCAKQFFDILTKKDPPLISDIEKVFSVENVTDEFFEEYKWLFIKLKEELDKVMNGDSKVRAEFEERGISTVDFSKKLLGQIMFLYFLQKKGWLGVERGKEWGYGPKNFMRKLFEKEFVDYDNFFNDILEPLFYEALSTERIDDYYTHLKCKIPFLNGGLFEPMNDYDWVGTDIIIDNSVFEEIFRVFDTFNFTVKEDEPLEKEVAVDPEMLGKVLEKLGGINDKNFEEWKKIVLSGDKKEEMKFNKQNGVYYTPREIVHYMCQQSLINYLETNTDIQREDIEKFIVKGDAILDSLIREEEYNGEAEGEKLPESIKENYREIDRLLRHITIVDPAVGSGAFPVGMLNEIVKARNILGVFFDPKEREKRTSYNLKRETIENSLYGVDIDSSAVDIAKLRFWLSLIVDEEDMKNIKPLPNLDYKIMCGNSLLEEFEGVKLFDERFLEDSGLKGPEAAELETINEEIKRLDIELSDIPFGQGNREVYEKAERLEELRKRKKKLEKKIISGAKDEAQKTIEEAVSQTVRESQRKLREFEALQKVFFDENSPNRKRELRKELDELEWELIEATLKEQGNEEAMEKLEKYKRTKSKPFFLWKLHFAEVFQRENPGFDVVIGNPPYITFSLGKKQKVFSKEEIETYKKIYFDVYEYKGNTFSLFLRKTKDLLRSEGYSSYIVPNTLLLNTTFSKIRKFLLTRLNLISLINIKDKVFEEAEIGGNLIISFSNTVSKPVVYVTEILDINNFEAEVKSLSPINKDLYQDSGLFKFYTDTTALHLLNKFRENSIDLGDVVMFYQGIITGNNSKFISDRKDTELHEKILRGRDINKYAKRFSGNYVLFDKSQLWSNTNEKNFKVIEKLINRQTGDSLVAAYDDEQYFTLDSTHVQILKNDAYLLKYVLALFNSTLFNFIYRIMVQEEGRTFAQIKTVILKQLPVKVIEVSKQRVFVNYVDQILSITKDDDYLDNPEKQARVKELEKEIDRLVYELYGLTDEEIDIVENFNKGN